MPLNIRELTTELHKLQKKVNIQEGIITVLKEAIGRFQSICRKTGWILLALSGFICSFDMVARILHSTRLFSFTYNQGYGIGQMSGIIISGGLGLLLVIAGYWGSR